MDTENLTYSQRYYRSRRAENVRRYNARKRERLNKDFNALAYELVRSAQARAKKRDLDFDLTHEDIEIPELCPVLGVPLQRLTPYAPSLDRIDPTRGYTKDNVQVMSRKANTMKQDASPAELQAFAKWILGNAV